MPSVTTLFLADAYPLFRSGLRGCIEEHADFEIVGEHGDGYQAMKRVRTLRPDALVLDPEMPTLDGYGVMMRLTEAGVQPHILVLTRSNESADCLHYVRKGVQGYMTRFCTADEIMDTLRRIMDGECPVLDVVSAERLVKEIARAEGTAPLTSRELEILHALVDYEHNAKIAIMLGLKESTVEVHLRHIYRKLHVHSRHEAKIIGFRAGLLGTLAPIA